MFQSMSNIPDHASVTLSSNMSVTVKQEAGWDSSDDDDERLVIDMDESVCKNEYSDVSSASEGEPSHLKEILQTGVYTGNYENIFKQNSVEAKEKPKPNSVIIKREDMLSADQIQTLNLRADEYMRKNFMQYQGPNSRTSNFKLNVGLSLLSPNETVDERAGQPYNQMKFEEETNEPQDLSRKLSCDICNRTYKFLGNLSRHRKSHADATLHQCDVCHRRFMNNSTLILHMKVHTEDKPFTCELCQRKFAYKSNLTAHKRVHTGYKPYVCEHCGAKFSRKFILTAHKRTHTGEKPFACRLCDRKYSNKTNLQTHMTSHDEKMYSCNVCDTRFSRKFILTRHEKTHAGYKPFACHCGKKFTRSFTLKIHQRTHTGDKPFTCSICPDTFACHQYLKSHRKKHQADGTDPFLNKYRALEGVLKNNKMVQTDG